MRHSWLLAAVPVVLFALLPLNVQAGPPQLARVAPDSLTGAVRLGPAVSLPGSLPRLAATRPIGSPAPSRILTVSVGMRLRNQAGLVKLLHDLYTPGSALFHHWLTPTQFQVRFAPLPAQRLAITRWLHSRTLQVTQNCDNLLITAVARVDRIEAAFGTRLFLYRQAGRTVFANAAPAHVPQGLAPLIASIGGLTNANRPHPLGGLRRPARQTDGFTPSQLADAYGFTPLYQHGYVGAGHSIALAEFTAFDNNNINTFDDAFNLPAPGLQLVPVTVGGSTGGTTINIKEEGEAEMDVEVAHAMAPGATVLVYQGPDTSDSSSVWCHIVQDNHADVIATSYGLDEKHELNSGSQEMDLQDSLFQQAAAQGETVLAASGDNGAYDVPDFDPATAPLQVDFPASDPWVTGVGGTSIFQQPDGSLLETAWSSTQEKTGGGGGLSTYFHRPEWQTGPGVDNKYSNGYRQVPDIAALADNDNPGYQVYSADTNGNVGWGVTGGTSAASPLWAAFVAVADGATGRREGFLNPALYALGADTQPVYNDVTQGDNLYYHATPGWDFATGWGSMNGPALLDALAGTTVYVPPTATPTPTPTPTPTVTPTPKITPTATRTPPKPKVLKCKKGYKKVKVKGKLVCKKVKKK
jgi:kumamolisin